MLSAETRAAFNTFYDSVRDESVLGKKMTILIGLAAAMACGCAP